MGLVRSLLVVGGVLVAGCAVAPPALGFEYFRDPDGSTATVDPSTTAQPIEVLLWVRPGVSTANENRTIGFIEQALRGWEDIPTSRLRFRTTRVYGSVQPARSSTQMLIRIANLSTIKNDPPPNSGASVPVDGAPGIWWGAVADISGDYTRAAAHEIGHALGFAHSSVGFSSFPDQQAIMHWSLQGVVGLTQEDVAAASYAYPDLQNPPAATLGAIKLRTTNSVSGQPLSGVNAVAVNRATGQATVARVSGMAGVAGQAELLGLSPGTYDIQLLDGESFDGCCLGGSGNNIQVSNFPTRVLGPYSVAAGQVRDIGTVSLPVAPISIERFRKADTTVPTVPGSTIDFPSSSGMLPPIRQSTPYDIWVQLAGGARPLTVESVTGLPPGFTWNKEDTETTGSARELGKSWIRLRGSTIWLGRYQVRFTVRDAHGAVSTINATVDVPSFNAGAGTIIYKSRIYDTVSIKGFNSNLAPGPGYTFEGVWRVHVNTLNPLNTGFDHVVDVPVTCSLTFSCKGSVTKLLQGGRYKAKSSFSARRSGNGIWKITWRAKDALVRNDPAGNEMVDISFCPPGATTAGAGKCAQGIYGFRLQAPRAPFYFKLYK